MTDQEQLAREQTVPNRVDGESLDTRMGGGPPRIPPGQILVVPQSPETNRSLFHTISLYGCLFQLVGLFAALWIITGIIAIFAILT